MKKYTKPEVYEIEVSDVVRASYGRVDDDGFGIDYGEDIFG